MSLPYTVEEIGWYAAGWAVFSRGVREPEFFPPLNDIDAQREWLGGFGAAWVSGADDEESVDEALVRVMTGKEELLRQPAESPHRMGEPGGALSAGYKPRGRHTIELPYG